MNLSRTGAAGPSRRGLLALASWTACRVGAQPATAPPTAPVVWRGLDQAALDASFDLPRAVPTIGQITGRWASNSELARAALGAPRRLAYGPTPAEALDFYPAPAAPAPLHVFVHGGAFNLEQASHFGFLAEASVRAGAHFAALDFARARDVGGDIRVLVAQVRKAVAWLRTHAADLSIDAERIYLSGHSSGAELAACVMVTDWAADFSLPKDTLKGALCCSGVYDLAALRLSSAGAGFRLGEPIEAELAVAPHADRLPGRLIVAHGSAETPAFRIGSRALVDALQARGRSAALLVAAGYNHFEVIETLGSPYGVLGRAMLGMMALS